jgi:hypothetical protein
MDSRETQEILSLFGFKKLNKQIFTFKVIFNIISPVNIDPLTKNINVGIVP